MIMFSAAILHDILKQKTQIHRMHAKIWVEEKVINAVGSSNLTLFKSLNSVNKSILIDTSYPE